MTFYRAQALFKFDFLLIWPFKKTSTCHCRPCRKITGATTSLNLPVQASAFKLQKGKLKNTTNTHVDEGFQFTVAFCRDCGSPIYAEAFIGPNAAAESNTLIFQAGTLDDAGPLEAPPAEELNIKYRLTWVGVVAGANQWQACV
ncbi:hypothetical protein FocnCong_v020501 [Fusarium oxysporum f. sp. conglutinans]|nr:hypothetical protein FocnCong_v020501 [Fusarium oxysporum f. sp. conglutinans]